MPLLRRKHGLRRHSTWLRWAFGTDTHCIWQRCFGKTARIYGLFKPNSDAIQAKKRPRSARITGASKAPFHQPPENQALRKPLRFQNFKPSGRLVKNFQISEGMLSPYFIRPPVLPISFRACYHRFLNVCPASLSPLTNQYVNVLTKNYASAHQDIENNCLPLSHNRHLSN